MIKLKALKFEPMERLQLDLTETARRALKANRGKEENLKAAYGSLESDYKAKRNIIDAEQNRFARLMKTKLPSITLSTEGEPRNGTVNKSFSFLAPPNSPITERQTAFLPPLVQQRSSSFSDLTKSEYFNKKDEQKRIFTRQSSDLHRTAEENLAEHFYMTRARSRSTSDLMQKHSEVNGRGSSKSTERTTNIIHRSAESEKNRKTSSPASFLSPVDLTHSYISISQRKTIAAEKTLSRQFAEVKDLRYLRAGRYSSDVTTVVKEIKPTADQSA